jgi:MFS family permease
MYFMTTLWQFIVIWALIVSVGFNLGLIGPLETAIANWFVRKRGTAIAFSRAGLGFGGALVVPFVTYLLIQYGWRLAFVISGFITWGIGLPLTWFFVKPHRPEYYGLLPDGATLDEVETKDKKSLVEVGVEYASNAGEIEFSVRQILRTRTYWIMFVTSILRTLVWPTTTLHGIPHLTDLGIDPIAAAGAIGFILFFSGFGRFVGGILTDRISKHRMKYLLICAYSLQALGVFVLINATTMELVYLYTVFVGFGMGMQFSTFPLMRGRYFGRKAFASLQGTDSMMRLPITVIAPIYVGWVYDTTGSYTTVFTQAFVLVTLAAIIAFLLKPPKPPTKVTNVKEFL